jgi:drug/metabolite transporter (DMT)-like permease
LNDAIGDSPEIVIVHHIVVSLAALGAACCFAASNVIEQRKASQAPPESSLRFTLLWHLAHQPIWWFAIGVDLGGFGLQVLALGLGEVVFVQPLIVTSLLLSLVIGALAGSHRLSRRDLGWALLFVVSLGLFLVAGDPSGGVAVQPWGEWAPVFAVIAALVIGCVLVGRRATRRAVALAAAAGMLFGVSSTLMKGFAHRVAHEGFGLLGHWQVYAMAAALTIGFLMMQSAFQVGDLRSALPAVELAEPLVAGVLGVVLLHEHLHVDSLVTGVLLAATIVAMIISTIRLAQSTAEETATEATDTASTQAETTGPDATTSARSSWAMPGDGVVAGLGCSGSEVFGQRTDRHH